MVFVGAPLPAHPALRLTMVAERECHGALLGAWWPRSLDLAAELPDLVVGLDAHGVGVTSSTGGHLDLLVIPPNVPVRLAGSAAAQAIDPANALTPTAILTRTMPAFVPDSLPAPR